MCLGTCPVYSVTLKRSRSAVYVGSRYVDWVGEYRAVLRRADFGVIAHAVAMLVADAPPPVDSIRLVRSAMEELSEGDRLILEARFGFGGEPPRTPDDVAHEFGLSKEEVRRLEQRVLRAARIPSRPTDQPRRSASVRLGEEVRVLPDHAPIAHICRLVDDLAATLLWRSVDESSTIPPVLGSPQTAPTWQEPHWTQRNGTW
jgi:hypothetical protein